MKSRDAKKEASGSRTVKNGSRPEAFKRPDSRDQQNTRGQKQTSKTPWRISVLFARFATSTARLVGKPVAFAIALATIVIWALLGPAFGFSDTWQLIINTSTTIVTFLMVFLIQNTQNRDGEAIQIKLDELIRSNRGAHNDLLDLEEMTAEDLHRIKKRYEALAEKARQRLGSGDSEAGQPKVDREE